MTLPHEHQDEEPAEDHDESHQPICPSNTHGIDPRSDVKRNRQAKGDTECVENDGRLLDVVGKALGQIIDCDGRNTHGCVDN